MNAVAWAPVLAVVLAYLLGSLSFAVMVSKAMGLSDPRSYGSGNPGATNVLRSGNKAAAALTLLFDALKGWAPVWAVGVWGDAWGLGEGTQALVGLAAFAGHVWPVFLRFKGGKGVATAAGVLMAFSPLLGLATLGVWVGVAVASRYSSAAALSAAVAAPALQLAMFDSGATLGAVVVMSLVLILRHRSNIEKLIAGQESKLGAGAHTPRAAARSGQKARANRGSKA
jgi:glycerol-3-phosphate acyltransferase PlsY